MDGDGDLDVVTQSADFDSRLSWYANTDGAGVFGDEQVITNTSYSGRGVRLGDMDNDGDQDVVFYSGVDHRVAWSENADGLGNFDDAVTISTNLTGFVQHTTLQLEDVDGDNDLDVLAASGKVFKLFENSNGLFEQETALNVFTIARLGQFLGAVDVDGDDDLDVVSVFDQTYGWHENVDGKGTFGEQQSLATAFSFAFGDADGDGDQDYFYFTANLDGSEATSAWVENDGSGHFGAVHEFSTAFSRIQTMDLDGDGNLDVVAYPWGTFEPAFYKNDGNGDFATPIPIPKGPADPQFVDIDQDGDLDLLRIEAGPFDVETMTFAIQFGWQEFTGGDTLYGEQQTLGTIRAERPIPPNGSLSDFDGDGDLDLLLIGKGPSSSISWVENVDGTYQFENQRVIQMGAEQPVGGPPESLLILEGVHNVDIDGDGDVDVLARNTHLDFTIIPPERSGQLVLFENLDGKGHFRDQQVLVSSGPSLSALATADLDGDSDVDFLYLSSGIGWYENRPAGDSNNDGVFNSEDLVIALAAGEYEDGLNNNSTYEEGDWNGDGNFDSGDIVFAFKAGTYVAAAQAQTMNHIAAVDSLFAGHEDRKTRQVNKPTASTYERLLESN